MQAILRHHGENSQVPPLGIFTLKDVSPLWRKGHFIDCMNAPIPPNRIREFREARGWSLQDLEDACGIKLRTLQKKETRKLHLKTTEAKIIAAALGVHPSELMEGEGDDEIRKAMRDVERLEKAYQDEILRYIDRTVKLAKIEGGDQGKDAPPPKKP